MHSERLAIAYSAGRQKLVGNRICRQFSAAQAESPAAASLARAVERFNASR
jgi:hypothetical protein